MASTTIPMASTPFTETSSSRSRCKRKKPIRPKVLSTILSSILASETANSTPSRSMNSTNNGGFSNPTSLSDGQTNILSKKKIDIIRDKLKRKTKSVEILKKPNTLKVSKQSLNLFSKKILDTKNMRNIYRRKKKENINKKNKKKKKKIFY
jgi:hypothetical protein